MGDAERRWWGAQMDTAAALMDAIGRGAVVIHQDGWTEDDTLRAKIAAYKEEEARYNAHCEAVEASQ